MNRTTKKSEKAKPNQSAELQKLTLNTEKAKKAADRAYANYEKKSDAYLKCHEEGADKAASFPLAAAMKIARFTYKIKRLELKLAKVELKIAKKTLKKAAQKAPKAIAPTNGESKKSKKSAKAIRKAEG